MMIKNKTKIGLAAFIALSTTVLMSPIANAACLAERTRSYSEWVNDQLLDALHVVHIAAQTGNPDAEAAAAATLAALAAAAGTTAGQLIDFGEARWWDPEIEVFPNDIGSIVTPITDSQISAVSSDLLLDLTGPILTVNEADLYDLNTISAGMGDASVNLLHKSVRAFAHVVQGAAAYSQDGQGSASVITAANLLNQDLADYREALTQFAPFFDLVNTNPQFLPVDTSITASGYLNFLNDVKQNGAAAIPAAEVNFGEGIAALANVHFQSVNITLTNGLVSYLSEGDTSNEAAVFPVDGFKYSGLVKSGINNFTPDVRTCTICKQPEQVPEPLTILGSVTALGFGAYAERKRKPSNSSEKDNTKTS